MKVAYRPVHILSELGSLFSERSASTVSKVDCDNIATRTMASSLIIC